MKIIRVSTVPFFVATQLKDQISDLKCAGFDVDIVSSPGVEVELIKEDLCIKWHLIEISRSIDLIKDITALFRLYNLFKALKPVIVHSTTPKAGLLSSIAAFVSGVPIRLHTFTGQPWYGWSGMKSNLSKKSDVLISRLVTKCFADSQSQKEFLIKNQIVNKHKIKVLGFGSLAGVNIHRFNPVKFSDDQKRIFMKSLGLPSNAFVFIFIGRITVEKGVLELIKAFRDVEKNNQNVWLLLVGDVDKDGGNNRQDHISFEGTKNIIRVGYQKEPEIFLSISHVLVIPSHREGFGTVVIEAASMGVPAIGSRIYGLTDAIEEGVTGMLVEPKNIEELKSAMLMSISNHDLIKAYGFNARKRALSEFSSRKINGELIAEYNKLIKQYLSFDYE